MTRIIGVGSSTTPDYSGTNMKTEWSSGNQTTLNRAKETNQHYASKDEPPIDMKSYAFLSSGDPDGFLQSLENDIEGNVLSGNGKKGDFSWDRYCTSTGDINDMVFQSADGSTYVNINFTHSYATLMSEKVFAQNMGMDFSNGKSYDYIVVGQDLVRFTDIKFSGTGDNSQDITSINLSSGSNVKWGRNASFTAIELHLGSATGNPYTENPEEQKANLTMAELQEMESQWMTEGIRQQLEASKFPKSSPKYWELYKLLAFMALNDEIDVSFAMVM